MNKIDLKKLIGELDTAVGMLIIAARHDATVREAKQKIIDVSYALGESAMAEEE